MPWKLRAAPRRPTRCAAHRGAHSPRARRGRARRPGARARGRPELEKRPAAAVEEVGVVEVDVDEAWQRAARGARERGRRASASSGSRRARCPTAARCAQARLSEAQRSPAREVRRTCCPRRAVDVAELRAGLGDLDVRVPAAAAEQRRGEAALPQAALPRRATLRAGRVAGRARVVGRRPVRVVAERAARCSLARALEPGRLVLAVRRVRRSHERRDREAAGPRVLERGEPRPDGVVERSLNVAGDDRVPFPRRGAHRRRS